MGLVERLKVEKRKRAFLIAIKNGQNIDIAAQECRNKIRQIFPPGPMGAEKAKPYLDDFDAYIATNIKIKGQNDFTPKGNNENNNRAWEEIQNENARLSNQFNGLAAKLNEQFGDFDRERNSQISQSRDVNRHLKAMIAELGHSQIANEAAKKGALDALAELEGRNK